MDDQENISRDQLLKEVTDLRRRVSELEISAEKLKQSEERYHSVVTTMTEGVVMQTRSGEIVACNQAAEQILGLTQVQMMSQTSVDPRWRAVHEDGTPFPGETHPAMVTLRTGQPQRNAMMGVYKPDGKLTWVLVNSEPLFQPGTSEPYAVVTTFSDMTEQRQAEELLRQNEEKYRVIFNNEIYAICIFDLETLKLLDVNEAFARLYGYSRAELLSGMTYHDITAEPQASAVATRQAVKEGTIFVPLRYHRKKDGTIFPTEIVGGAYQWQGRKVIFILVHDITKRRQAEQALQEKTEELDRYFVTSPDLFCIADTKGYFLRLNPQWQATLGYPIEELIGRQFMDFVHPDDVEATRQTVSQLETQQQIRNFVNRYRCQDGSYRWIEWNSSPQGHLIYAAARDITKRKQMEEALRESEARFRAVLKNNSIVIFNQDRELRYTRLYNPNSRFTVEAVLGKTDADLFPAAEAAQLTDIKRRVMETGVGERHVVQLSLDDSVFYYDMTIEPVFDRNIDIMGVTCAAMDVSEQKRAETALYEQEYNFRTFFDTIEDLLFVLNEQGTILWCNQTVIRKLGYTETELQGQGVLMIHPPEWREEAGRTVQAMLAGQADYCPIPVLTKDGRQIPVETRVCQGQWSGRKVIFGVTKDLSSLKASEEKFSKAFHTSPALMAISELGSDRFIEVNDMFLEVLGYQRDEIIGHTSAELGLFVQPEHRPAALQLVQEQGYLRNFESPVRAKSGEVHYGIFAAEYIHLQDQILLLTVMNDITERKQAETEREHLIAELQAALTKVNQLEGILPICGFCKKIRDKDNQWYPMESYISRHSQAEFSHTFCPSCGREHYPEYFTEPVEAGTG